MRAALVAIVVLAACKGGVFPLFPDEPKPIPPQGGPTGTSLPAPAPASRELQREADPIPMRVRLLADPPGTLIGLGIGVDDFEVIAWALYRRWAQEHPEAVKARSARTPPPETAPVDSTDPRENQRWWCYESSDVSVGDCRDTKAECESARARYLTVTPKSTPTCPAGLTQEQCFDSAVSVAAQIQRVRECEHIDRAACFRLHLALRDVDVLVCAPTVKHCKERRAYAIREMSDDGRVKSECAPL